MCFSLLSYGYTRRRESPICVATALWGAWVEHGCMDKRNRCCVVCYTRRFISQWPLRHKSVCVNVAFGSSVTTLIDQVSQDTVDLVSTGWKSLLLTKASLSITHRTGDVVSNFYPYLPFILAFPTIVNGQICFSACLLCKLFELFIIQCWIYNVYWVSSYVTNCKLSLPCLHKNWFTISVLTSFKAMIDHFTIPATWLKTV